MKSTIYNFVYKKYRRKLKKFGYTLPKTEKDSWSGSFAQVYDIGNNIVMKVTEDSDDALAMFSFKKKPSDFIVPVYDVMKFEIDNIDEFETEESTLYIIFSVKADKRMDSNNTASCFFHHEDKNLYKEFSKFIKSKKNILILHKTIADLGKIKSYSLSHLQDYAIEFAKDNGLSYGTAFLITQKLYSISKSDREVRDFFFNWYIPAIDELWNKRHLTFTDFAKRNVMMFKDEPKIIDLGFYSNPPKRKIQNLDEKRYKK